MPNFKKLAKGYEKEAILALQKYIRIPSVYDEHTGYGPFCCRKAAVKST